MTASQAREPILDEDWLLRRIPDQPTMWTRKDGPLRPSSPALNDQGLSVDVRRPFRTRRSPRQPSASEPRTA